MHLSSRAPQTDTSTAKTSFTKKIWMHLSSYKASDKTNMLEAVYERLEIRGKQKDEARRKEAE